MKLTHNENIYFHQHIQQLIKLTEIQKMGHYIQHGNTSCLEHCLTVSYYSYLLAKHLNIKVDEASLIRGSLLHDFFLYDWHNKTAHPPFHGLRHPRIALANASKYFHLTDIECDIILHHMWPLTPMPPHTKEAYIVTLIDKWCSLKETLHKPSRSEVLIPYITYYTTT